MRATLPLPMPAGERSSGAGPFALRPYCDAREARFLKVPSRLAECWPSIHGGGKSARHGAVGSAASSFAGLSRRPGRKGVPTCSASSSLGKNVRLRDPLGGCSIGAGAEAAAESTRFDVCHRSNYRHLHAVGRTQRRCWRRPDFPRHLRCADWSLCRAHWKALLGLAAGETQGRRRRHSRVLRPSHRWCRSAAPCRRRGP